MYSFWGFFFRVFSLHVYRCLLHNVCASLCNITPAIFVGPGTAMPLYNYIYGVISVINTFARANTCCPRSYLLPGPRGREGSCRRREGGKTFWTRFDRSRTFSLGVYMHVRTLCESMRVCTRIRRSAHKGSTGRGRRGNTRSINRAMRTGGGR